MVMQIVMMLIIMVVSLVSNSLLQRSGNIDVLGQLYRHGGFIRICSRRYDVCIALMVV